jgi:hypothetical protein
MMSADVEGSPAALLAAALLARGALSAALPLAAASSGCPLFFFRAMAAIHSGPVLQRGVALCRRRQKFTAR